MSFKLKAPLLDGQQEGEARKYSPKPPTEDQWTKLFWFNIVGLVLHGAAFLFVLSVAIWSTVAGFSTRIPGLISWDFGAFVPGNTTFMGPLPAPSFAGPYPLIWLDAAFPLVTALFHGGIAWSLRNPDGYYRHELTERNRNPLRWIEYSITATTMTWVICQLVGITNIFLLLAVAVFGNIILQIMGHLMETLNSDRSKGVNWWPTIIGWVIFAGQWACIWTYFLYAAINAPTGPPTFVYIVVIGLFIAYDLFGLVQLLHYVNCRNFLNSTFAVEAAFITLSLTAKLLLVITPSIMLIIFGTA